MPVVRQLTTRFAFETDRRGIKNFQDTVGGMRRALIAAAGAFGAGKILSAAAKAGSSLNLLAARAQQFTDDIVRLDDGTVKIVGDLGEAFERVKRNIPGVETTRDFLQAFIDFKQDFPAGTIAQFEAMFEAAGLIAKINGKPLIDVFSAIQGAVESGDFQAISNMVAGFGLSEAAMENFVRNLQEVDPTGVATVEQRLRGIVEVLKEAIPGLKKTAEEIQETTSSAQWDTLMSNIKATFDFVSSKLEPAMVKLAKATNAYFEEWTRGEGIVKPILEGIQRALRRITAGIEDPGKIIPGFIRGLEDLVTGAREGAIDFVRRTVPQEPESTGFFRDLFPAPVVRFLEKLSPSPQAPTIGPRSPRPEIFRGGAASPDRFAPPVSGPVTIAPTFNITGTNANEIGQQIVDKFTQLLEEAGISFPAIEGIPSPGG